MKYLYLIRGISKLLFAVIIILINVSACEKNGKTDSDYKEKPTHKSLKLPDNSAFIYNNILLRALDSFGLRTSIPIYTVHIRTQDFSHIVNAFLVGPKDTTRYTADYTNFDHWVFHDRMNNITFKNNLFIPNSVISIRVPVWGEISGQAIDTTRSPSITHLEIVRFKTDEKGYASLDFYLDNIIIEPSDETVEEYIQDSMDSTILDNKINNKIIVMNSNHAKNYSNSGIRHYQNRNLLKAVVAFKKAIRINPFFAEVYYNLGLVYVDEENYDYAIYLFNKAIGIDSLDKEKRTNLADNFNQMGIAYAGKKEFIKAKKNIKKAIDLNPMHFKAYYDLAKVYSLTDSHKTAINYYKQAEKINPNYGFIYSGLGAEYASTGETDLAIQNLEKAIELMPNYSNHYYNLGLLFESLIEDQSSKDWKNMVDNFSKAAELGNTDAKMKLASYLKMIEEIR